MLAAVNQEDYMRAIMGDDHSAWRICRSQYPCGTTYGVEVDLPVQKGDLEAAKKMIQEAGYNGQKAVIINPTDFPTIGPLGDITYDMLKKIGINVDLQATDWGSVVQRRASKEPVEKGGWSIFHTWFTGGFILNPVVTAPFRGAGATAWFGWYDNPKIEQLTQDWLDAKDEDARKKIAAAIQIENYTQVPTVNLGQFQIPTAYRKSLAGKLEATGRCSGTSSGCSASITPLLLRQDLRDPRVRAVDIRQSLALCDTRERYLLGLLHGDRAFRCRLDLAGGITSTPFSSARIASPGATDTPPHDTGVPNSPCRNSRLPVTVDRPRAHTGRPYSRSSSMSVAMPSTMMPTQPAARAANATPPPHAA